ncbi:MAG: [acyl-carrier-protein] S-malonyltransferase [Flavobacteriaceae bacterium]|nr:[acyl-carrier-protein] S-malonyltransferase [Flavobacteriaceae bacterium]|tara:strand:+ start:4172 stop:5050 length:879 start_codon:yes stop_codon:yes gene_type:complete
MKAYIFPGQGSQFRGMGKELYKNKKAKSLFEEANSILGFNISDIMFEGSEKDLTNTNVTQPAIFIHSVIITKIMEESFKPNLVAGHSLGEFSALSAVEAFSFEEGLLMVSIRAKAMQKACAKTDGTMAAILGVSDQTIENVCNNIDGIVVAANYNCPGQLVISGETTAIEKACRDLKEKGAKRAITLPVGGAFHSKLMDSAKEDLSKAIQKTNFKEPKCAVYQNFTAAPSINPDIIKSNLVSQLTAPVKWTQTIKKMIEDGAKSFIEVGPGNVLQNLNKKIDSSYETSSASI